MRHTSPIHKLPFLLSLGAVLLATSCAKRVHLTPATTVPAATATANVSHDSNGNTIVTLDVKHLAKPENLSPSRSVYVVWTQVAGQPPVKQGELKVNNNLEAKFRAPVTAKTFDLFVTAEDSATVMSPTGQKVLEQQITG